jgi:hypothetical protein
MRAQDFKMVLPVSEPLLIKPNFVKRPKFGPKVTKKRKIYLKTLFAHLSYQLQLFLKKDFKMRVLSSILQCAYSRSYKRKKALKKA